MTAVQTKNLRNPLVRNDDGVVLSKDNSDTLTKLEKEFNVSEQDGADIHGNLANIVQKLLKDKPEEGKLNEVKKRYLRPKNCEMLAETRVNLAIWNNLSERASTSDLKLQKVQKSLIKGSTAVVQVVNDLISKPDMPSKGQIIKQHMDGVLLLANANIELNLRRREALKPELHTSYRYLCAPSNPITTELFGDDLPKAVKDITDTNRITSKLSRERFNIKAKRATESVELSIDNISVKEFSIAKFLGMLINKKIIAA